MKTQLDQLVHDIERGSTARYASSELSWLSTLQRGEISSLFERLSNLLSDSENRNDHDRALEPVLGTIVGPMLQGRAHQSDLDSEIQTKLPEDTLVVSTARLYSALGKERVECGTIC